MTMWPVGTRLVHARTGAIREVIRITPAGANGTRVSDGPTWHARIVGPDRITVPSGHVADIRYESYSYPAAEWSALVEETDGHG